LLTHHWRYNILINEIQLDLDNTTAKLTFVIKSTKKPVREPIQVYLAEGERRLLDQLAKDAGVSRAEVLRRGIAAVARESQPWETSPVLEFVRRVQAEGAGLPPDVGERHDDYLADEGRRGP
jgi:hypothetical protein